MDRYAIPIVCCGCCVRPYSYSRTRKPPGVAREDIGLQRRASWQDCRDEGGEALKKVTLLPTVEGEVSTWEISDDHKVECSPCAHNLRERSKNNP